MATKPRARPVKVSDAKKAADARNKAAKLARTGKYSKAIKVQKEASKSRKMTKTEKQVIAAKPFVPQIVPQPPQTAVSEKGMTLRQLMKSTPRLMVENSFDCYITKLKRGKTKKGLPVVTSRVRFKDPFRPSAQVRLHEVLIVGLDDPFKPINKQKRVLVSCGCENYVYMWEYANAVHGAARIIYGNGAPPSYTNPANQPGLCKHAYRLAREMIELGI